MPSPPLVISVHLTPREYVGSVGGSRNTVIEDSISQYFDLLDFSKFFRKYPRFQISPEISRNIPGFEPSRVSERPKRTCKHAQLASWMIMNIYICRYMQLIRQVYERFSHMLTTFDRLGDLTYYLPPHTPHYTHYITTDPHNGCCSRHDPRPCPRRQPFTYSYYCDHTY